MLQRCVNSTAVSLARSYGSSVSAEESAKFAALANTWWDRSGPFSALHRLNPSRVQFIKETACATFKQDPCSPRPLAPLNVVEIGCGGGLLCEPLARLGAAVLGVDVAAANIAAAEAHAACDAEALRNLRYQTVTAEELAANKRLFDIVVASEVIEHVVDPAGFLSTLVQLTQPKGQVILSTINRTARSYAIAILGAEYVARVVPPGTHDWSKFLSPQEMEDMMKYEGMELDRIAGMTLRLPSGRFSLSGDTGINYIASFSRKLA